MLLITRKVLENSQLIVFQLDEQDELIFQQNNVVIHTTKLRKPWVVSQNIKVIDWPAKYSNMIPIENQ